MIYNIKKIIYIFIMIFTRVLLLIMSFSLSIEYIINSYNLKIIKNHKKISIDDINNNKNNIKELLLERNNKKIYIKLNNGTEYNYYNNKCTDILGVLPILSLLTK